MENWKTKENKSSFSSQGKVRKFLNVTRKSGKSQGILVQSRKIISKKNSHGKYKNSSFCTFFLKINSTFRKKCQSSVNIV